MSSSPGLFVVRIAGLPAEVIEGFGSRELMEEVEGVLGLETELADLQSKLVDELHGAVGGAPRETRHALLGAKRDAYNGRTLRLGLEDPAWERAPEALETARRVTDLQAEIQARTNALLRAARTIRTADRRHLLDQLDDRQLSRGLTLASPDWWAASKRLRKRPPERWKRKERSLEQSLLRYVSRAALKLSPYSTFTRLGLCRTLEDDRRPARLVGEEWSSRSIFRLKRFLVDQALSLAVRHPAVRDPLVVVVNETLRRVEPGLYQVLRPGYWQLDEEGEEFRYFIDSRVKVRVDDAWVERLHNRLADEATPWRDLVTHLAAPEEGPEPNPEERAEVEQLLTAWLSTGLLQLLWPWPSNAPQVEKDLAAYLGELPDEPAIIRFREVVERLVELETAWGATDAGGALLREIDRLLVDLKTSAALLAGIDPGRVDSPPAAKGNYYEDVFVADRTGGGSPGTVFEISRESLETAFADVEPEVRLAYLYNHRHDFLPSLAHLMEREWPKGGPVPLLEVFQRAQPLWQESRRYRRKTRGAAGGLSDSFNPYELDAVAELAEIKRRIWAETDRWIDHGADGMRIDPRLLGDYVEDLPTGYRPAIGACLLLQPLEPRGERWVLNRMYEGVARYSSRFTGAMEEPERQLYTRHLLQRGVVQVDGEPAELLDLVRPQGDILNVHAIQTPLALDFPGERSDVPAERRRTLDQLYLSVDRGADLLPGLATVRLTDSRGRRLLPVHLGGTAPFLMPSLIKFLVVLGVGEILPIYPVRPLRQEASGAQVRDRLVMGRVVLQRKRWIFRSEQVPRELLDLPEDRAFLAWNRWRLSRGLPQRLYLQEVTPHFVLPDRYKPQYVDFSSPSFVSLLAASMTQDKTPLVFDEALPDPASLPPDAGSGRRAVELQVDRLALERDTDFTAASERRSRRRHDRLPVTADSSSAGHPLTWASHAQTNRRNMP